MKASGTALGPDRAHGRRAGAPTGRMTAPRPNLHTWMALRARNHSPRGLATLDPQSTCHGPRPEPKLARGARAGSLRATEPRARETTCGRKSKKCRRAKKNTFIHSNICFFSIPCIIFALLFSLFPSRITQIRDHIAGSSPPSPLRFVPCTFIARRFQLFLPLSTPVELCLPKLRALSSSSLLTFFASMNSKSHHGGTGTPGLTLVTFEGYH